MSRVLGMSLQAAAALLGAAIGTAPPLPRWEAKPNRKARRAAASRARKAKTSKTKKEADR